jgi:hypothetical protein
MNNYLEFKIILSNVLLCVNMYTLEPKTRASKHPSSLITLAKHSFSDLMHKCISSQFLTLYSGITFLCTVFKLAFRILSR